MNKYIAIAIIAIGLGSTPAFAQDRDHPQQDQSGGGDHGNRGGQGDHMNRGGGHRGHASQRRHGRAHHRRD